MVEKYSLKTDGNKKLSENFTVREFASKDGADTVLVDTETVRILQDIRDHFGKPVVINSAYRTPEYNKKVGGVSNSQHVLGKACDISISGVSPKEVAQYAEYLMPDYGGIGEYSSFTHIDTREVRSRWQNFGSEIVISGFPGYFEKREVKTPAEAIDVLNKAGIINTPEIWYDGTWTDENFKTLLMKFANYVLEEK